MECMLCGIDNDWVCRDCFVPWHHTWRYRIDLRSAPKWLWQDLKAGGSVCYQCVAEREYGLDVRDSLSSEQKIQLDNIELWQDLKPGGSLIYQCIAEREYGLDVRDSLSSEQKVQLDKIENNATPQVSEDTWGTVSEDSWEIVSEVTLLSEDSREIVSEDSWELVNKQDSAREDSREY